PKPPAATSRYAVGMRQTVRTIVAQPPAGKPLADTADLPLRPPAPAMIHLPRAGKRHALEIQSRCARTAVGKGCHSAGPAAQILLRNPLQYHPLRRADPRRYKTGFLVPSRGASTTCNPVPMVDKAPGRLPIPTETCRERSIPFQIVQRCYYPPEPT